MRTKAEIESEIINLKALAPRLKSSADTADALFDANILSWVLGKTDCSPSESYADLLASELPNHK